MAEPEPQASEQKPKLELKDVFRFDLPTSRVRAVAFMEGSSYLVLLFIAMPVKYLAGQPVLVRFMGAVHGALFVWLMLLALFGMVSRGKHFGWAFRIGLASLVPFGTFFLDKDLRADDDEARLARER